jgi:hypothetical protein
MFNNFFSKNRAFYGVMSKNVVDPEGPRHHNMVHASFMLDKQGYTHALARGQVPAHRHI